MQKLSDVLEGKGSKGPIVRTEPVCKLCNDGGYVRRDRPIGHPMFGHAEVCECVRKKPAEKLFLVIGNISKESLSRFTFENFVVDPDRNSNQYHKVKEFTERPYSTLVIQGESGTGKTHLAIAAAWHTKSHSMYVSAPDLFDELRKEMKDNSTQMHTVSTISFLVIDDISTTSVTAWTQEKLFQILNARFMADLPTVIASGYTMDEWKKNYPRVAPRLQAGKGVTLT